jgi:predicted transglutaminase-like cysteine proteinase
MVGLKTRFTNPAHHSGSAMEPRMDGLRHAFSGFQPKRHASHAALIGIAVIFFLSLARVGPAFAEMPLELRPATEAAFPTGPAQPTQAWIRFCEQLPDDCAVDLGEPKAITLNPDIWSIIVAVNERVNSIILPVTDQDHWGELDRWDYPDDGLGDCEDIQLLKRRLLVAAGVPRRTLRMTVVVDQQGAGHAVMMVRTDWGDFILDNKRNAVLPWGQTGYVYVKREGTDSTAWVSLGDQTAPIVTANR